MTGVVVVVHHLAEGDANGLNLDVLPKFKPAVPCPP